MSQILTFLIFVTLLRCTNGIQSWLVKNICLVGHSTNPKTGKQSLSAAHAVSVCLIHITESDNIPLYICGIYYSRLDFNPFKSYSFLGKGSAELYGSHLSPSSIYIQLLYLLSVISLRRKSWEIIWERYLKRIPIPARALRIFIIPHF